MLPQKRHLIASSRISSAQNGHRFTAPSASYVRSDREIEVAGTRTARRIAGPFRHDRSRLSTSRRWAAGHRGGSGAAGAGAAHAAARGLVFLPTHPSAVPDHQGQDEPDPGEDRHRLAVDDDLQDREEHDPAGERGADQRFGCVDLHTRDGHHLPGDEGDREEKVEHADPTRTALRLRPEYTEIDALPWEEEIDDVKCTSN